MHEQLTKIQADLNKAFSQLHSCFREDKDLHTNKEVMQQFYKILDALYCLVDGVNFYKKVTEKIKSFEAGDAELYACIKDALKLIRPTTIKERMELCGIVLGGEGSIDDILYGIDSLFLALKEVSEEDKLELLSNCAKALAKY